MDRFRRSESTPAEAPAAAIASVSVTPSYSSASTWAQFVSQLRIDLRGVIRSVPFYVLLAFALMNTLGGFLVGIGSMYGTPSMPLTRSMLLVVGGSFVFVTYIVLMYYAGNSSSASGSHASTRSSTRHRFRRVSCRRPRSWRRCSLWR